MARGAFEGLNFFFGAHEDWAAPEVGGVVSGAKCTVGWYDVLHHI